MHAVLMPVAAMTGDSIASPESSRFVQHLPFRHAAVNTACRNTDGQSLAEASYFTISTLFAIDGLRRAMAKFAERARTRKPDMPRGRQWERKWQCQSSLPSHWWQVR